MQTARHMESLRPHTVNIDAKWVPIRDILTTLLDHKNTSKLTKQAWLERFFDVYEICIASQGDMVWQLYSRINELMSSLFHIIGQELLSTVPDQLLLQYQLIWKNFDMGRRMLDRMFGYMDKHFLKNPTVERSPTKGRTYQGQCEQLSFGNPMQQVFSVSELAKMNWDLYVMSINIHRLNEQSMIELEKSRNSKTIPGEDDKVTTTVPTYVKSLSEAHHSDAYDLKFSTYATNSDRVDTLKLYQSTFEKEVISRTKTFYKTFSEYNLSGLVELRRENPTDMAASEEAALEYMRLVEGTLEKERARLKYFVHESSTDAIMYACLNQLMIANMPLLEPYVNHFLNTNNLVGLAKMFDLLGNAKPLEMIAKKFGHYVARVYDEQIGNCLKPDEFIRCSTTLLHNFKKITLNTFKDDAMFVKSCDEAFARSINRGLDIATSDRKLGRSASAMLAQNFDMIAKRMNNSKEVDSAVHDSLTLLRYLYDKDMFFKFYCRRSAIRLSYVITDSTLESKLLSRLKPDFGSDYVTRLQKMFTDTQLSADLTKRFKMSEQNTEAIPMNVMVFQAGAWPLSVSTEVAYRIPDKLRACLDQFDKFYCKIHSGRRIKWILNMATADVEVKYADKPYILHVTVPQLLILLCFEVSDESLTFEDLLRMTALDGSLLKPSLAPLVSATALNASNDGKVYQLNRSITRNRIKVQMYTHSLLTSLHEGELSIQIANKQVEQDRTHHLKATIVRIMKKHKRISRRVIMQEIIEETRSRFIPSVSSINASIESLIESQFLERTEDGEGYSYLV